MKNIAILSDLYPTIRSGMSDYIYNYTNLLANKNYNISFFTQTNFKIADSHKNINFKQIIDKNPLSILKTLYYLKKNNNIDFVHLEFPSSKNNLMIHLMLITLLSLIILRKKIILRLHEYSERPKLKKIVIILMGFVATHIITNNYVDLKNLSKLGLIGNIFSKKISFIPIGSNIKRHKFTSESLNKLRDSFSNLFLVGFFGDIYLSHEQKGGVLLIEIIKILINDYHLSNILFIIIGGNHKIKDYFYKKLGIYSKYIYFTGYLSEKDVSKYLQVCDIMIAPFKNGFIFNRGSLLASIVHNKCILTTFNKEENYSNDLKKSIIFFEKSDPSIFAKKINYLIQNKGIIKKYENKISSMENIFSWERIVNQFDVFYNKICY